MTERTRAGIQLIGVFAAAVVLVAAIDLLTNSIDHIPVLMGSSILHRYGAVADRATARQSVCLSVRDATAGAA